MKTTSSQMRHACAAAVAVSGLAILVACNESVTAPVLGAPSSLVSSIVEHVYLPTFDSLNARATRLSAALDALTASPTPGNLATAQDAWRSTREIYERNEGFAFGPLITNAYDPSMDTWPIDRSGIDALVTGGSPITKAEIDDENAYTDLLVHDMGPALADNRADFLASGSEWRTSPLWGIGLTPVVNAHTNFLHDGRARSLLEAVMWHGGQATAARETVRQASPDDRNALIAFLNSL